MKVTDIIPIISVEEMKQISDEAYRNHMIPKLIHLCYIDDELTPTFEKTITRMKEVLLNSGYKFYLWKPETYQGRKLYFLNYFAKNNKAFYADYIRLYALHKYGGIYLDCDVECIKPFDDLLSLDYAISNEIIYKNPDGYFENRIDAGVMLFKINNKIINDCLFYFIMYFNKATNLNKKIILPNLIKKVLKLKLYNISFGNSIIDIKNKEPNENTFNVLYSDYFSDNSNDRNNIFNIDKSERYCCHFFSNTWV